MLIENHTTFIVEERELTLFLTLASWEAKSEAMGRYVCCPSISSAQHDDDALWSFVILWLT